MKNKKLFAILTLVCFMFTLMPVAAFAAPTTYAEVAEDYDYVDVNEAIKIDIFNAIEGSASTDSFYVFAVNANTDRVYGDLFKSETGLANNDSVEFKIAKSGSYKMYVVDQTPYTTAVKDRYAKAEITAREAANLMIAASKVAVLASDVVVKSVDSEYVLQVVKVDGKAVEKNAVSLDANNGYDEVEVTVQLNEATYDENGKLVKVGDAVVGATLDVDTNSYVIDVDKTEVRTNAVGQAKFVVSASTAGNFKVYVEYGTKADLEIAVTSGALTPAAINTTAEPKAPVALDSDLADAGVYFSITDANGNAVSAVKDKDKGNMDAAFAYKVVVDAPKGANIDKVNEKGNGVVLQLTAKGWTLANATFDEEGTYTFKVVLANGAYATASVKVKEFQKPVELKVTYPTNTVELGGTITPDSVVYVDANGVTKAAKDAELSATGYAIDTFVGGTVKVKADEKYVGSVIKVIAVSEKYNLVDNVELTVANEAAGVKYFTTAADVAVNNTLVANVVDADGNKVALTGTLVKDATYDIQYIVVEKPANAKVAVSTKATTDLLAKGQFMVSFTASTAGEYKIQTVVRVAQEDAVVKYYSGVDTITVGGTGIKDVVVMSIGSEQIIINNTVEKMLCEAVIKDGRTMVPFRAGLEALGATVDYVAETQSVIAEMNGTKVVMTIGEKVYTVNGVAKTADVAPYLNAEASTTMVPASFVAKAFGINVNYTTNPDGTVADVLFAN